VLVTVKRTSRFGVACSGEAGMTVEVEVIDGNDCCDRMEDSIEGEATGGEEALMGALFVSD
jgi:hypothetical protein